MSATVLLASVQKSLWLQGMWVNIVKDCSAHKYTPSKVCTLDAKALNTNISFLDISGRTVVVKGNGSLVSELTQVCDNVQCRQWLLLGARCRKRCSIHRLTSSSRLLCLSHCPTVSPFSIPQRNVHHRPFIFLCISDQSIMCRRKIPMMKYTCIVPFLARGE